MNHAETISHEGIVTKITDDELELIMKMRTLSTSHVEQVKTALGVSGVSSENAAWTMRGMDGQKGMQIDLIISRSDRVINLCEMKFLSKEYDPQADDETKLRARIATLQEHLSPKQTIHLTLVTTVGLKHNAHSGIFQQAVTIDSLF